MSATMEWENLVLNLRGFMGQFPSPKVILGLSRGFDSTMVAAIAAEAVGGENVLGVALPSMYSEDQYLTESKELAEHLGIQFMSVPIHSAYNTTMDELSLADHQMTAEWSNLQENLQSRLRAVILMALSNGGKGIVLNCSNLSERLLGYYTIGGDDIGSVSPIGNYLKTELWDIARGVNEARGEEVIPEYIINARPTAELAPGQTDEDALGVDYETTDRILSEFLSLPESELGDLSSVVQIIAKNLSIDERTVQSIMGRVYKNSFKRAPMPVIPTATGRAA